MKANDLLTQAEQDALRQCVADVESRTSGEIVPIIATQSHHYPQPALMGALILSTPVALILAWILGTEDMWSFLIYLFGANIVFYMLTDRIPAVRRLFIRKSAMQAEVREAAVTNFYLRGLFETRDRTGILIYVSVYERTVWVLADSGINAKVDPQVWQEIVSMVTHGIRDKKPGEALCRAVTRCGELIATHFPVRPDDTNELPDLIIAD